jgi:transcriptional regulator with PAS, ATPase and Fis domain
VIAEWEDKKLAKRAANRLSAHLSRKRKKMFIDDLTAENTDLRRKVQILQTIPDLIVVFDSSGCISFISQSVSTLLDITYQELEGTSFWNCLAEDSVKIIKSAFMDALAEKRKLEDDPTPLCHGKQMLVKLVDKNAGETRAVSLKGVVHFTGVAPECVCSIRPIEAGVSINRNGFENESHHENVNAVTGARRSHNVSDGESVKKRNISNDRCSSRGK